MKHFNAATQFDSSLKRCSAAFRHVRGVVPDPKLSKQLVAYHEAIVLIQNKMLDIVDPEHIYVECELGNLIAKTAKRDKKFRDALALTGFK